MLVAPGTYVEIIDFHGKAITVVSAAGAAVTTIDGDRADSVVTFASGETRAAVLDGFTVRNGESRFDTRGSGDGGGVRIAGSSPIVRHSSIVDNTACEGAGINIRSGSPLIQSNVIAGNHRIGCSGGVGGGGILIGGSGGATTEILDNVIVDNGTGTDGGGIALNAAGAVTIRGNVIARNRASDMGGGISLLNLSEVLIVQNIITGNFAGTGGGGIANPFGARLVNNTIAGNDSMLGSAIFAGFNAQSLVVNNLIVGKAGQPAIYCQAPDVLAPQVLRFNNVFTPGGDAYAGCPNQTGLAGNISADPRFVDEPDGDYRLGAGSPAIDAGDSAEPELPSTDIEGKPRVVDGDSNSTAIVDMGADEFDPTVTLVVVSPALQEFGVLALAVSADRIFTVRNAGSTATTVDVTTASPFSVLSGATLHLAPGASQPVTIRFRPDHSGTFTGIVAFASEGRTVAREVAGTGAPTFTLTVVTEGDGLVTVTSDLPGISCGSDCSHGYVSGTVVHLTAAIGSHSGFAGFLGCDSVVDTACTVTLTANRVVTVLADRLIALSVAKAGTGSGVISDLETGIFCGSRCAVRVLSGISVVLDATPDPGSVLVGWNQCSGTGSCTVEMTSPRLVIATFAAVTDLDVSHLSAPAVAQTGRPFPVSVAVWNRGRLTAPPSRVTFYMSPSDPAPGAGTAVGFANVSGLTPTLQTFAKATLTVPVGFAPGPYYISAVATGGPGTIEPFLDNNGVTAGTQVNVSAFGPDLTIVALTTPAAGQTGRPLTVTALIRNIGRAAASGFRLAFFMSPTDPTPGAGTAVGVRDFAGLAAGVNASAPTTFTIPIGFDAGAYYLSAIVDSKSAVAEIDETNNRLTAPAQVTVSLSRPDLTIASLSAPATGKTGQPLKVTALVRNIGPVAAGGFRLTFFMSPTDPTPGAGTAIGFRDFTGLASGINASVPTTLTIPVVLDAGAYYLSAVVDSKNAVIELDETNNGLTAPAQIAVSLFRPDLTIASLTAPATGKTGQPLSVTALIRNIGAVAAPGFRLTFFMSPNDPAPGAGTAIGFRDFTGLAPGINASAPTTLTIPIAFDAGAYYLSAVIDSKNAVVELDETNNGLTAPAQITVSLFRPDLTIASLAAPATGKTGQPLNVTAILRNTGQVAAGSFRLTYYMSLGDPAPGAGTIVGFRDVPSLAPGVNASVMTAVTVPVRFDPGDYFVSAVIDPGNAVVELDDSNNGRTAPSPVTITLSRADLTVVALTAPATGFVSRPLTLGAIVRNVGQVAATAFRLSFFLSPLDSTPGAGVALGFRDVAGVMPGINASVTATLTVPGALAPGSYYVSAVVDSNDGVGELSESNNGRTAANQVSLAAFQPDLVVTALSGPSSGFGIAGRAISVTSTVRNLRSVPVGPFRVAFYLSADGLLDPGDIRLGTRTVASLAADGVSTASSSLVIPPQTPSFDYFLIAAVDDDQRVTELVETNNGLVTPNTIAVLPNMVATFGVDLRLVLSACTNPDFNNDSGLQPILLRISTQTGRPFSGTNNFTEIDDGVFVVTSLTLNGSVDTGGDFTGSFTMRVTANGVAFITGTGPLSGSVLGSQLSGTFTGPVSILGGDTCQLAGAFTPS